MPEDSLLDSGRDLAQMGSHRMVSTGCHSRKTRVCCSLCQDLSTVCHMSAKPSACFTLGGPSQSLSRAHLPQVVHMYMHEGCPAME